MASSAKYYGDRVFADDARRIQDGLNELAENLVSAIKSSMPEDGGYKRYKRPWGEHWSSRPGSPPAIDYGRLHDSISYNYPRSGRRNGVVESRAFHKDGVGQPNDCQVGIRVGSKVPYAAKVELGEGIVAPRPYLAPWARFTTFISRLLDERLIIQFKK